MKWFIFILSLLLGMGCGGQESLNESSVLKTRIQNTPNRTLRTGCKPFIELNRFDTLVLRFAEYPGRAYSWELITPDTLLTNLKLEQVKRTAQNQVPDSEQKVEFYFLAVKKGEELLQFKYFRPWEKNKPGADSCITKIKINP